MTTRLAKLHQRIVSLLGKGLVEISLSPLEELTIVCNADDLLAIIKVLRDDPLLEFEQLIDLCGVDYQEYPRQQMHRFATVYHLLSVSLNHRIRLKTFAQNDDFPILPSIVALYPVANWFERESFDLFGILYEGHPDLRRLLTDYGFVGYPFRKDFPMIGEVEMRFDAEQKRVIYEPVSIELRNEVTRTIAPEGKGSHG